MRPHEFRIASRIAFFAFAAIIAFTFGCRTVTSPNSLNGTPITTTIAGRVTDESGAAVTGVTITGQSGTATTDANGLFVISNTSVPSNRAFITAKKSGYFDGARAAIPTANGVTYMQITLAGNPPIGTIDAASGGSVTLPTGGSLTLGANGVVTSSGAAYSGPVSISAEHLDPAKGDFAGLFAGDLTAQQIDGSQTELQSYGVIVAELHGSNGETLQPAPGAPATLTMPIASALQATAPPTISLWFFDDTLGMWKEEGSAYKQGSDYVGTVPHFCQWNYDGSVKEFGTITGVIVCNDVPIPGVVVNLGAYVEGGQPYVVTDGSGRFTVRVAANSNAVVLQVLANENNGVYWTSVPITEIVPPNVTTDVGQIALSSPCPSYLTGKLLDCNSQPTPGMVLASWSGGMSYIYTTSGQFQLFAGANTNVTIAATASNGAVAQPQTVTAGNQGDVISIPNIVACSGASDVLKDISGTFTGTAVAFSPDGTKLATLGASTSDIVLLDVNSGNVLNHIPATSGVLRLTFSADGSELLGLEGTSNYGTIYPTGFECWKTDGTKLTGLVTSNSACFTQDGSGIIAWTNTGAVQYDLATNTIVETFSVPFPKYANAAAIAGRTGNGTQFIAVSADSAVVWDIASNSNVRAFKLSATAIDSGYAVVGSQVSPDGSILGSANYNSLAFYNTQSGSQLNTGQTTTPYGTSYNIDPDDQSFIGQYRTGGANTVGLFKIADGSSAHLFDAPASFGNSSGVAISPDGKLAAAVYGSEIRVWNVQ